ncbi:unnamed protein product [Hydatigera taeniaeformis]|uniref:Filamin/ABP280 repeat protein n=1 Tax=Hydatigena taeniaeformis TaxID=6205 RepID=A0A0R3XBQ5_HYDTA|nr:unnamed protein product [Hydatigera taeniaeformis]
MRISGDMSSGTPYSSALEMCECKMGTEGNEAVGKENVLPTLEKASLQMLSDLRNRCEELDDALAMLDSTKKEIEGQINQCFQTILRTLEERRLVLFSDLESSLQKRRYIIEELMKNMEERSQKLTVTTELIKQYHIHEKSLCNGENMEKYEEASHEIRRRNAEDQLRFLLGIPVPIHPSTTDILSYFPIDLDKLLSLVKNFGAIGMTSVDSDQTSIVEPESGGSHVMRCVVNEVYFQKVLAVDSQGRIVGAVNPKEFSVSLTHRPVHMNEVSVIEPQSKAESSAFDNSVLIRLKLANPGFYELNVKVLGEHIRNSPYRVHCLPRMGRAAEDWKMVFTELSEHIELRRGPLQYIKRSTSELHLPRLPPPPQALADELSWNKNGLIFAIEFGSETGQMVRPTSVAETINSNYLISDFDLHCIHVFQPSGSYMSRFGQRNLAGPYVSILLVTFHPKEALRMIKSYQIIAQEAI